MRRPLLLVLLPLLLTACLPHLSGVVYNGTYKRDEIKQLADRGDPYAMMVLGEFYYRGFDGPKDLDEAAKLYAASAKKGNPFAGERLAAMQRGDTHVSIAHDIWQRLEYSARPSTAPEID
ncbi:MAG: sel1 repeat family protein [SAR202 cluster bacterium]|nr:sel1 repeat family protein [SAR202 cluster bacterium]